MPSEIDEIAALHLAVLEQLGVPATLTSVHRTTAQQAKLYAERARNKYPVAKPGFSQHEYAAAYDIVAHRASDQRVVEYVGRELGMQTTKNDPPHFQLFSDADWRQILAENPPEPATGTNLLPDDPFEGNLIIDTAEALAQDYFPGPGVYAMKGVKAATGYLYRWLIGR